MGLDTTHDAWHGPYSAFNRWRTNVAQLAGYEVAPRDYGHGCMLPAVVKVYDGLQDGTWTEANLEGWWERLPEDPLLVLLVHSDCDGFIDGVACRWLAERLEQLMPKLVELDQFVAGGCFLGLGAEVDPPVSRIGSWAGATQQFIDGCRRAAEANEPLEFH